jgi:hypothetical protein
MRDQTSQAFDRRFGETVAQKGKSDFLEVNSLGSQIPIQLGAGEYVQASPEADIEDTAIRRPRAKRPICTICHPNRSGRNAEKFETSFRL